MAEIRLYQVYTPVRTVIQTISLPTKKSHNNALQGEVLYPEQAFQFVLGSAL
jgi:hypothetical protein